MEDEVWVLKFKGYNVAEKIVGDGCGIFVTLCRLS